METDKILVHYVQFVVDMFCAFSRHKNTVTHLVGTDMVRVEFYDSPNWKPFQCDVKFNSLNTPETQILMAFNKR